MFVVLLRFSAGKSRGSELLAAHNEWIKQGFDDGAFLLVGSLSPGLGGAVIVDGLGRGELEERLRGDPFVAQDVVKAEVLEVAPSKADPRLAFLLA